MNIFIEKELPNRMLFLRQRKQLSQQQVADIIQVSKPYYNRIENGIRSISISQLKTLSLALDGDFEELLSLYLVDKISSTFLDMPYGTIKKAFELLNKKIN